MARIIFSILGKIRDFHFGLFPDLVKGISLNRHFHGQNGSALPAAANAKEFPAFSIFFGLCQKQCFFQKPAPLPKRPAEV